MRAAAKRFERLKTMADNDTTEPTPASPVRVTRHWGMGITTSQAADATKGATVTVDFPVRISAVAQVPEIVAGNPSQAGSLEPGSMAPQENVALSARATMGARGSARLTTSRVLNAETGRYTFGGGAAQPDEATPAPPASNQSPAAFDPSAFDSSAFQAGVRHQRLNLAAASTADAIEPIEPPPLPPADAAAPLPGTGAEPLRTVIADATMSTSTMLDVSSPGPTGPAEAPRSPYEGGMRPHGPVGGKPSDADAASQLSGAGGMSAEAIIAPATPRRARARRMRTAVGKAIQRNQTTVVLQAGALLLLLEEKIASLKDERPNEPEAIARRDEAVMLYEGLKQQLEAIRTTAVELEQPKGESKAAQSAVSFTQGVRNWWNKKHVDICNHTFEAGLFLSCAALCSLMGAGGPLAVVVSGAVVKGKPVVEALKAVAKRLGGD